MPRRTWSDDDIATLERSTSPAAGLRPHGADTSPSPVRDIDPLAATSSLQAASRYATRSVLGRGGMGEVQLCHDGRIGRDVALKVIRSDIATDDELVGRFLREARVQGQLEHPAIGPFLLQLAGILPCEYRYRGGDLIVHSSALRFPALPTSILLLAASVGTIVTVGLVMIRTKERLVRVETQLHLQRWQLAQLMPRRKGLTTTSAGAAARGAA